MSLNIADRWIRRFRVMTISLIFSGALNIGLTAALVVTVLGQREEFSYAAPRSLPKQSLLTNHQLLTSYANMSFHELAALLTNNEFVEEGYRKRDLALSALVSFHFFDLERALGGLSPQRRSVTAQDKVFELFPDLQEEQFQALIRFAYLEKWPLTPQGIFLQAQRSQDDSLFDAMSHTREFCQLQALFQQCSQGPSAKELYDLIREGNWQMLEGFSLEQSQMLDLTDERRRSLLLSYLAHQSKTAAKLLIRTDFDLVLKRLDDKGILDLLGKLEAGESGARNFCQALLQSARSDAVWKKSAEILYQSVGEKMPEPFSSAQVLARFLPGACPEGKALQKKQVEPTAKKHHVVQEGENLWKISRRYKVKIEEIVAQNGLEQEQIYPGMILQIP